MALKPVKPLQEVYLNFDGAPIDVEVSAAPFSFKGEHGSQVILRDITARKRAEEALRANERRYRLLAETINDVMDHSSLEGFQP